MNLKDEFYYQAMELINAGDENQALKLLEQAFELDPDCAQTHVGLVAVYKRVGDKENAKKHTDLGYEAVRKMYPKWPKELSWGFLENRALTRAIANKAELYIKEGEQEKGLELYELLLKLNPNDNMGIRYIVAGIYAELTHDDIDEMFNEGNENQDWSKLEQLVERENKKHRFWVPSKEKD